MATGFDPSEFIDDDFQAGRTAGATAAKAPATFMFSAPGTPDAGRAPSREELDARAGDMQNKLAELKRVQQELERERSDLEETRRRQAEFTRGRQEMEQHLTRGVGLLEEAEFTARRDAEQMSKALADLREALVRIQGIHEETWTKDNLNAELTRALTAVENARMEWNSARLKFPILSGAQAAPAENPPAAPSQSLENVLQQKSYAELCKLGLALTWPIVLVAIAIFLVLLRR
jgi:DNA repair exonuclease SbcCD ATPase subunit